MLEEAVAAASALEELLRTELERSGLEREALRTLDSDRLFAGAAARASFNARVAEVEGRLEVAIGRVATALGLEEVTLEKLAEVSPDGAAQLSETLAEVRRLAAGLAELDRLHLALAGRTLACVQGYLTALAPAPAAYDRRGAPVGGSGGGTSTTSHKV